jgi:hypothetical protein
VDCRYHRYSGKQATWRNHHLKLPKIGVCGAPLPLLPNNVLSCFHYYSGMPHDVFVVSAYVGKPQPLDSGMGIENHTITHLLIYCSGTPTYGITTLAS